MPVEPAMQQKTLGGWAAKLEIPPWRLLPTICYPLQPSELSSDQRGLFRLDHELLRLGACSQSLPSTSFRTSRSSHTAATMQSFRHGTISLLVALNVTMGFVISCFGSIGPRNFQIPQALHTPIVLLIAGQQGVQATRGCVSIARSS